MNQENLRLALLGIIFAAQGQKLRSRGSSSTPTLDLYYPIDVHIGVSDNWKRLGMHLHEDCNGARARLLHLQPSGLGKRLSERVDNSGMRCAVAGEDAHVFCQTLAVAEIKR
jgi:hypothetical protein